jgi:hypothetical protein
LTIDAEYQMDQAAPASSSMNKQNSFGAFLQTLCGAADKERTSFSCKKQKLPSSEVSAVIVAVDNAATVTPLSVTDMAAQRFCW